MYREEEIDRKKWSKRIVIGAVVFIILSAVISAIFIVRPGYRGVVVTMGKVEQVSYENGIGVKWPFVSRMYEMPIQTQKIEDTSVSYTSDVQTASVNYTLTYELCPENVHVLYEKVGRDYEAKKIRPVINDVMKDVVGKQQAQSFVANRDKVREQIQIALVAAFKKEGSDRYFQNINFLITNLDYSDAFEKAIENKVIAEQRAQEAANKTQQVREEAEQKVISAKAEAEAMEIKTRALQQNKALIEYEAIQKWDGKLPVYNLGGSVPMIQLPNGK